MGYVEHLPVRYSDDPSQRFPAIIYQHGASCERDQGDLFPMSATPVDNRSPA
jgi:hypothetical protein